MPKKSYDVILPHDYKVQSAELEAASILANYFQGNVRILSPSNDYMVKTADFIINEISYELKSPITKSVRSIENMIHLATKQSGNVIVDIRKSKITEKRMVKLCEDLLKYYKKLSKIVLIVKNKKVLEFSKKM